MGDKRIRFFLLSSFSFGIWRYCNISSIHCIIINIGNTAGRPTNIKSHHNQRNLHWFWFQTLLFWLTVWQIIWNYRTSITIITSPEDRTKKLLYFIARFIGETLTSKSVSCLCLFFVVLFCLFRPDCILSCFFFFFPRFVYLCIMLFLVKKKMLLIPKLILV